MFCQPLAIPDVKLITPKKFGDDRGFFSETYNQQTMHAIGIADFFVQDNHSFSTQKHTLRGLHFQTPPYAQAKLIRVVRGAIWDVAVDIRKSSPTFGQYVAAELSAENWQQLYIPVGFAHGFITLTENTEICYKTSAMYAPNHDAGILWNDPALRIVWPAMADQVVLSAKDKTLPVLNMITTVFA